jgi:hypothetical protein
VIVAYLLLAAPLVAAVLLWGSWVLAALALMVFVVEYLALQRSQRFAAHFWRSIGVGRKSRREHGTESVYVASTIAGVFLLAVAIVNVIT